MTPDSEAAPPVLPDEVSIARDPSGNFVLSRPGFGSIAVNARQLVQMAGSLRKVARDIQRRAAADVGSSSAHPVLHAEVKRVSVTSDLIGAFVLLELVDNYDNSSIFGLPPDHARQIADRLRDCASKVVDINKASSKQ